MSQGRDDALELIAALSKLKESELKAALEHKIKIEAEAVRQQLRFGKEFSGVYDNQLTREDFDRTYRELKQTGVADPKLILKHEADFYSELMTNENKIGRDFVAQIRASRLTNPNIIGALDQIAENKGIKQTDLAKTLRKNLDTERTPSPNLTDDELHYVQVRRMITEYMMMNFLKSEPKDAPKLLKSVWAEAV